MKLRFRLAIFVFALTFVLVQIPLAAFAGSTGVINGTLADATTGSPLGGATVSAASPSQTATAKTDATGGFAFLSLSPDTYTVSVEKAGYESLSVVVTVTADQTQRLVLRATTNLKTIGGVRSRPASSLVKPGAVTDSYSVNASTQERVTGLGGGGSLNQAFSALAATPGIFVPSGQNGWSQMAGVTIRGGTHSQIGYEFDGVPVNVGFNAFPGNNLSTLGQQEVQVYTGSAPTNSESQGLSGFVNQVIKTGTYPGFTTLKFSLGSPAFYNQASIEAGGASKSRLFSWFAGILAANQAFRVVDQFNGASRTFPNGYAYDVQPCPTPVTAANANFAACYPSTPGGLGTGPGGFVYAPPNFLSPAYNRDRENIVNLHFGVPHKHDTLRDDIQLLFQTGGIKSDYYSSANDLGVPAYNYPVGNVYTGALAQTLPTNYASLVQKYGFPNALGTQIPATLRDEQQNNQSILKAQYTHNMGNSYVRAYAYSLYSNFLFNAPNGASSPASNAFGEPPDYKLWTHTSGYSAEYTNQLSNAHLFSAQASFSHAPSVRDNSTTWATSTSRAFAVAVDSTNPNSGLCYGIAGAIATPGSCQTGDGQATFITYKAALAGTAPPSLAGLTCGGGACAYYTIENGLRGTNNVVGQDTIAASLSDQWRPSDRLTVDYGVRFHQYHVIGADTTGGARNFWFNAYNQDYCVNATPGNTPISKAGLGIPVTASCASASSGGVTYAPVTMLNSPANYTFNEIEPRIGSTYSLGPNDVLRLSYGRYTQPTPTSFQQYDTHQQNLASYLAPRFYKYGYTGSGHNIPPQSSTNIDFSWEHGFSASDVSMKLTPFYRTTKNELTEFFIDPINQLTSGLPVGSLTTGGVEFQLRKGSFDRQGLSALVSYTYTNSRIKYQSLPGGGSIVSPINNDIKTYNAYTSFCAANASDSRCGSTTATDKSGKSAACFTAAGIPDAACGAGSIANPYWNAPVQALLDPNGSYIPTDPVVATTGLGVNGYNVPHVATFVLNYRRGGFAITPSVQIQGGQRYGAPEANAGIDPGQGCKTLPGSPLAGDPRYPYGAPGGSPYDATSCNAALNAIPNVYTKTFDGIGAFTSPTQLLGSMTLSYDFSKRFGTTLVVSNLINQCFGGSKQAWTNGGPHVCSYESGEISRANAPTGNAYNPGATFEPFAQYPYFGYAGPYTMGVVNPNAPFNVFLSFHARL